MAITINIENGILIMGILIACASDKGGTGKTTIAHTLAVAAEKRGKSVCVVDADPMYLTQYWLKKRAEMHNTSIVLKTAMAGEDQRDAFAELKKQFDITFVDCAGYDNPAMRSALLRADIAIVPTMPSQLDVLAYRYVANNLKPEFEKVNSAIKFRAVLTCAETLPSQFSEIIDIKDAVRGFGVDMAQNHLSRRKAFKRLFLKGGSCYESGDTKAIQEAEALFDEIIVPHLI
ncbi:AAA family ATPase [Vibrio parahaemolyticus]|nr:AAA family ATPase [Vibrio parahaemolyticus]MDF5522470.1 AAA family ATPase [Vibrio parahaemolyticus]